MQGFKLLTSSHNNTNNISMQSAEKIPKAIKKVLEESYLVISDLKEKCKSYQSQLNQKDTIINKLLQEKQDHILHLSYCQTGSLKKQLEQANKHAIQMKNNFQLILTDCYKNIQKYKQDLQRLRGFNKVLRIENNHLREQLKQNHSNWRQRENKIGKITQINYLQEDKDRNINKFSYTRNKFYQIQQNQTVESATPIKFKTSKSTNLSTAAKSNSKQYSKGLTGKQTLLPRQLFQNTLLKQQINPTNQISSLKDRPSQDEVVGILFSKLKKLLAQSDEEN